MSLIRDAAGSISVALAGSVIPWTYLTGSVAAATALVFLSNKLSGRPAHKCNLPLPPGPPATWFWDNSVPKNNVARELAELVEQYGPVVSFRCGSNVTVVIGRMDAATEIMEKEGSALADRPHMVAVGDIMSGGMRLHLTPSGERLRRLRRAAHSHLQVQVAETYENVQAEAAKGVILDILNDPKHHIQHAKRYSTSVMLRVMYGKTTPTSNDDPEVIGMRKAWENFLSALRGGYLVDFIPWLKYVPGYARRLSELHQYELSLYRDQLSRVRRNVETNSAAPSLSKTLLEHLDDHRLSDDEMAYLAGTLFATGADTTASGITAMIMAAALYPDAQTRVQDELDDVVGRDRVPTFRDWETLPQLQAFILEAMRWRPVTPLGIPHRATKDIIWRGQCIPAGATVIGSHWAISRDPVVFPDPESFNPGRWLTEEERIRTDMHFYTFGFGRRVCPGQYMANRSLYVNLALLLWSFRIVQRPGVPIDMHASALPDVIIFHAKPFDVDFVPRVEEGRLRELMA